MVTKHEVLSVEHDERTRIYSVSGSLFGNQDGYAFQNRVRGAIAAGASRVVIDLRGVDKIDSSGIGILVAMMWSASNAGGGMILTALPPKVEQVLGIAMLLEHIDHADSVEAALTKLDAQT